MEPFNWIVELSDVKSLLTEKLDQVSFKNFLNTLQRNIVKLYYIINMSLLFYTKKVKDGVLSYEIFDINICLKSLLLFINIIIVNLSM